jgi:threonine dehydratase
MRLDIHRILLAPTYINKVFLNTPQYECEELSRVLGCRLFLKVETQNPVRCFKGRGTETALSRLQAQDARQWCVRARAILDRHSLTAVG